MIDPTLLNVKLKAGDSQRILAFGGKGGKQNYDKKPALQSKGLRFDRNRNLTEMVVLK